MLDPTGLYKEKGKVRTETIARERATDSQWQMVEAAINAFAEKYPHVWEAFTTDMTKERSHHDLIDNKYAEIIKDKSLKKVETERRKTATFPSAQWYNADGELETDSLLWIIECIIPGLTHKYSVNYVEFLKRFPVFSPSWKLNV